MWSHGPLCPSQVFIINLLRDSKYYHFRPVMDTYIQKHFAGALAYKWVREQVLCDVHWTSVRTDSTLSLLQRADPLPEVVHGPLCRGGQAGPHTGGDEGKTLCWLRSHLHPPLPPGSSSHRSVGMSSQLYSVPPSAAQHTQIFSVSNGSLSC